MSRISSFACQKCDLSLQVLASRGVAALSEDSFEIREA